MYKTSRRALLFGVVLIAFYATLRQSVHAQTSAGYALSFNGSNYVSITTTGSVTGTFTVEAWVNPAVTNGFSEILSTRVPGEFSFDIQLNSGAGVHGDIGNGFSWITPTADASFAYASNQWFHVAYVVTPTGYTIYANGQQVGSGTYPSSTPVLYNATHPTITLGAWTPNAALLKGQLDEVRIWNVARSQAQIQSNLTVRLTGTEPGLVDYYRLDEPNVDGATTQFLDSTGRVNNGTPVNRPFRVCSTAPLAEALVLNGANPLTNECHSALNDPGAGIAPRSIAAKSDFSLALRADGTVAAWGYGSNGETNVPPTATNIQSIAAGTSHSLALRADGTVVGWGANFYGQTSVPATATGVVAIAAGLYHSLALRADGTVVAWGDNSYNQTNVPATATNVIAITAANLHSLALRADGTIVGWGLNQSGQFTIPASLGPAVGISAAGVYSLALRADGTVIGWGDNSSGQTNIPPAATNVMAIAAGLDFGLALRRDGRVIGWGDNAFGQLNIPSTATNVQAIAAGANFGLALKRDGTVIGWGYNGNGAITVSPAANNGIGVSISGNLDTNTVGNYALTYSTTTNAFGGFGKATRAVVIADTTPPQISLIGANPFNLLQGVAYAEPGETALDLCAGDLTSSIVVTGAVNTNILGTNVIGYLVTDASGNTGHTTRQVVVGKRPAISGLNAFVSDTNIITQTRTVTFDANVNPNAEPTVFTYYFGPTASYIAGSATVPIPASLTDANVPFPASGLSFGTVFHWAVVASNVFGVTSSPDQVVFVPSPYKAGDLNADGIVSQSELAAVYSNYLSGNNSGFRMTNLLGLGSRSVTFSLSDPGLSPFSVESSTNLTNWQVLGPASPRYLFTDTNAPASPRRFYRLRWP